MVRILPITLALLLLTATAFGGWGFAVGADTLGEQARRTPSIEPPIPRKTPALSSEPHVVPTAPTAISQSSSCEQPDTNGALYAPFLATDDYLRLTAKNTTSLGTYVPKDIEALGSAYSIRSGESGSLRKAAAAEFRRLVSAAAADGVTIRLVSGYRSCWTQRVLFNAYVAQYGLAEASRFSARPGQSEHQLGLAADIGGPTLGYTLSQDFGETKEGTCALAVLHPHSPAEVEGALRERS